MNKKELHFTKMHGCKNDYIYIDCTERMPEEPEKLSVLLSDRRTGIGGDGIILILPSEHADFRMRIFNADGSEAEMCGNGVRCVGKYVYDFGLTDKTLVTVETGIHDENASAEEISASVKELKLNLSGGKVSSVIVDMGKPVIETSLIPAVFPAPTVINAPITVNDEAYRITCVNMGNPHAVLFLEEISTLPLEKIGPYFEHHPMFPKRTNTEFIQIRSRKEIDMRVWERGSGETFACGTGACAAVYAGILNGLLDHSVLVHLLGGDLMIRYDEGADRLFMDGPATTVFNGSITLCD